MILAWLSVCHCTVTVKMEHMICTLPPVYVLVGDGMWLLFCDVGGWSDASVGQWKVTLFLVCTVLSVR